jgi:hypothetical protein
MSEYEYTHRQFWERNIISEIKKWNDKYDEACLRIWNDLERMKNEKIDKNNKDRV